MGALVIHDDWPAVKASDDDLIPWDRFYFSGDAVINGKFFAGR